MFFFYNNNNDNNNKQKNDQLNLPNAELFEEDVHFSIFSLFKLQFECLPADGSKYQFPLIVEKSFML